MAAFVGVGLTLYTIFYSLPLVPMWKAGPFSAYGCASIIAGLFCVLLALIFASLTSVMPRSGGGRRIGQTLCINPGSEANHGILRGYLIDIGRKGIELSQRVEG